LKFKKAEKSIILIFFSHNSFENVSEPFIGMPNADQDLTFFIFYSVADPGCLSRIPISPSQIRIRIKNLPGMYC